MSFKLAICILPGGTQPLSTSNVAIWVELDLVYASQKLHVDEANETAHYLPKLIITNVLLQIP